MFVEELKEMKANKAKHEKYFDWTDVLDAEWWQ